jgi:DNA-binding MarR family transcriptional regulator
LVLCVAARNNRAMSRRARLTDDEEATWLLMLALLEYLPLLVDQQLRKDSGLGRFEYGVLVALGRAENRTAPMLELSRVSFGSISRLSHAITALSERGFVERERRGGSRWVTLTDEGYRALTAAAPAHLQQLRAAVFDHIAPGDEQELTRLLTPIVENLKRWAASLT